MTSGASFSAGAPRLLHEGSYKAATNANTPYDVSRGGRFLMVVQSDSAQNARTRIDVVLNWLEELKPRVPAK